MPGSPLLVRVRNRVERARQHRWRTAAYTSGSRHVVMGGAPRSGTTLLRKLLDRHPELCSGPETKLFVPAAFNLDWLASAYALPRSELDEMLEASGSQGAFIDAFAARVSAAAGKARWAEKTPQNIRYLDWILARFPAASVVHIVRDGRDVVCSMREHPDWRWVDGAWRKVLVPRPLEWYARRWLDDTEAGMAWRHDARYVEVRYEDLAADPAGAMRTVSEAIGAAADVAWLQDVARGAATGSSPTQGVIPPTPGIVPPTPGIVPPTPGIVPPTPGRAHVAESGRESRRPDYEGAVSAASVGRWRAELSGAERDLVMRICGSRLRELGYEA